MLFFFSVFYQYFLYNGIFLFLFHFETIANFFSRFLFCFALHFANHYLSFSQSGNNNNNAYCHRKTCTLFGRWIDRKKRNKNNCKNRYNEVKSRKDLRCSVSSSIWWKKVYYCDLVRTATTHNLKWCAFFSFFFCSFAFQW